MFASINVWPVDEIIEGIKNALKGVVDVILTGLMKAAGEGIDSLIFTIYTSFIKIPTPGVSQDSQLNLANPPDNSFIGAADWTAEHLFWMSVAVATVGIGITGAKIAWRYANGAAVGLKNLLSGLLVMVLANLLVVQVVYALLWVGDRYSEWIIADAGKEFVDKGGWGDYTSAEALFSSVILTIFLFFGVLTSMLVQVILLIFRGAVLTLLVGTIVLPASAATTETGRRWLNRYLSWMMAFIAMKPAMATIYAVAFKLMVGDMSKDNFNMAPAFAGMILIMCAVLALPALLRLLSPAGAALAGSAAMASEGGGGGDSSSGDPSGSDQPQPVDQSGSGGKGGSSGSPSGSQETGGVGGDASGAGSAEGGGGGGSSGGTGGKPSTPKGGGGGGGGAAAEGGAAEAGAAGEASAGAGAGAAGVAGGVAGGVAAVAAAPVIAAGAATKYAGDTVQGHADEISQDGNESHGPVGAGQESDG